MTRTLPAWPALLCAGAGILIYAGLALGVFFPLEQPHFGSDIYDGYFYRLAEGRFDLPARMLRYEGHYTADGTGFLYHGFAPLLTRALLAPFVTLDALPVGPLSIWLWAVLGTGFYHLAFFQVARKFAPAGAGWAPLFWVTLLSVSVWFSSPGVLLSANTSLYHEPISITYAATGVSVFLMVRCIFFGLPFARVLIPLAILAGIVVHARPHIAVGLYAGVMLAAALSLWRPETRRIGRVIVAIGILVAFGLAFMQLNAVRFGSLTEAHGQFDGDISETEVQYGTVYWGYEEAQSARARTFVEYGRFNPHRILPNLALYTFDLPPAIVGEDGAARIAARHGQATQPRAGYGRIEGPRMGMLYLWPGWIALAMVGLLLGKPWRAGRLALPLVTATLLGAGLLLCYPTITLRYRAELWPLLMVICLLSLPGLMQVAADRGRGLQRTLMILSCVIVLPGVLLSLGTANRYTNIFQDNSGVFFAVWDAENCAARAQAKGFVDAETIARVCVDPDALYPARAGS